MVFNGRAVNEVAQSLGIGENLIYRWKSRYKAKAVATSGTPTGPVMTSEAEQALQRRIRELEVERDILKKALAIFSRQT